MRKPIIVGNWKMNKNNAETKAFFEAVDGVAASENATYGIGCPFTDLRTAFEKDEEQETGQSFREVEEAEVIEQKETKSDVKKVQL